MSVAAVAAPRRPRTGRPLRDRQCGRKVKYLSEMLARNAALLHSWAGRTGREAYKCGFCPDWHVGHRRGRPRS